MNEADLRRIAARQHGLLRFDQARAVLSADQVAHRLGTEWEQLRRGVYRLLAAPSTFEQCVLAACLAAGSDAVASHTTAARLWGLEGQEPGRLELTVLGRRRVRLRGVRAHRSTVFGPDHTTRLRAVPVTSPARTLCDLTACCPPWVVERAVDQALVRRLTSRSALERIFRQLATKGRRRSTVMRAILDARGTEGERADSPREARVVRVLRAAGLPAPVQQHRVTLGRRRFLVDLAYPECRVAVEYDGWDAHRTRSAFDHDRSRQNHLATLGWTVLRFTSASSDEHIASTVRDVLAAAARRAWVTNPGSGPAP